MEWIADPLLPIDEKCCRALQILKHLLELWVGLYEAHSGLSWRKILSSIHDLSGKGLVIQLIEFLDRVCFGVNKLPSVRSFNTRELSHVIGRHMLSIWRREVSHWASRGSGHVARGPPLHEQRLWKYAFIFVWFARGWMKDDLVGHFGRVVLFSLWGKA